MSYGTFDGWVTYASERGLDVEDTELSRQALTRATDHVKYTYVLDFAERFDETEVEVALAVYEAAAIELTSPNFFNTRFNPSQQKVLIEVKGIKWKPIGNSTDAMPRSAKIEKMLGRYMDQTDDLAPFGVYSVGG